jgi:hypothetical protein
MDHLILAIQAAPFLDLDNRGLVFFGEQITALFLAVYIHNEKTDDIGKG